MKMDTFANTRILKSSWSLFLCLAAMALVIFVNPNVAQSTDRLVVTDSTGANTEFAAGDNGTIRLNSNTFLGPTWALIYGSSNSSNTGLAMDSYGSPTAPATTVTLGGGAVFRFARGTQAAPTTVGVGDRLGFFVFGGYDGVNWVNAAGFTSKVDGTVVNGSNNVPTKLVFETLAQQGETADDGLRIERMIISSKGNVAIGGDTGSGIASPAHLFQVGLAYSDGTNWYQASSREYKENIRTLTTEEANHALDGLSPVKYNYKTDKEDNHVGFIAEDVPALVATKDRKGLSPMDIVAVLTRVVQEQKNTIAEQTNMISELSKKVDMMQQEINRVKGTNIVGSIGE